jgi:hypothetical protein
VVTPSQRLTSLQLKWGQMADRLLKSTSIIMWCRKAGMEKRLVSVNKVIKMMAITISKLLRKGCLIIRAVSLCKRGLETDPLILLIIIITLKKVKKISLTKDGTTIVKKWISTKGFRNIWEMILVNINKFRMRPINQTTMPNVTNNKETNRQ